LIWSRLASGLLAWVDWCGRRLGFDGRCFKWNRVGCGHDVDRQSLGHLFN
jgi:hypothetical protein